MQGILQDTPTSETGLLIPSIREEAFLCSSVRGLVCASHIDGQTIGTGKPGPILTKLGSDYLQHAESSAKTLWPQ